MVKKSQYRDLTDRTEELMEEVATKEEDLYVKRSGISSSLKRRKLLPDSYVICSHSKTRRNEIPMANGDEAFDQPFYCLTSYVEEYDEDLDKIAKKLDNEFPDVEIYTFQK